MTRCIAQKRGKFDVLRCCLNHEHDGPHNFVVVGVAPLDGKPGPRRKRSDTEYERDRRRKPQR